MRYALIAALFGVAIAAPWTSTIYETEIDTITSCAAEITECPGNKGSAAATATAVPVSVSSTPVVAPTAAPAPSASGKPAPPASGSPAPAAPPASGKPASPPVSGGPAPPASVKATAKATGGASGTAPKATGTGASSGYKLPTGTGTAIISKTSSPPTSYTGAASNVQAAGVMVGAGALAALLL